MQRSKYSKEFKDSTIQLILNNNEPVVKVAADLDINPQVLYNWISKYRKLHNLPIKEYTTSVSKEPINDEVKRLRRENKILKQWSGNLNQDTFLLIPKQPFHFVTSNKFLQI